MHTVSSIAALCAAVAVLFPAAAAAQSLGTTARQLPAGSLKILAYYQGVQDQTVKFSAAGAGACRSQNGAATFVCSGAGDVEAKGEGGAGLVKVLYQPFDNVQYYASFGAGDYSLSVPSVTLVNRLTGDKPGLVMTAGLRAVLYPDTMVTPAVAADLSVSRHRYWFDRSHAGDGSSDRAIDQRLDLMQYQVAVELSQIGRASCRERVS
jgi:hypothetical protein